MVLGRIILSVDGESYSLIKKRWLTKTFVTGDVLTFFIQLGGTLEMIQGPVAGGNLPPTGLALTFVQAAD
jgi:hypothetical protein